MWNNWGVPLPTVLHYLFLSIFLKSFSGSFLPQTSYFAGYLETKLQQKRAVQLTKMRAVVLVLASLGASVLIATGHVGFAKASKDSTEDVILQRNRRHVCQGMSDCGIAYFCDPTVGRCVHKHGLCVLLIGGRAVHGQWNHGACSVTGHSLAFEAGACFILVEGTAFRGRWQFGAGAGAGCVPEV